MSIEEFTESWKQGVAKASTFSQIKFNAEFSQFPLTTPRAGNIPWDFTPYDLQPQTVLLIHVPTLFLPTSSSSA